MKKKIVYIPNQEHNNPSSYSFDVKSIDSKFKQKKLDNKQRERINFKHKK